LSIYDNSEELPKSPKLPRVKIEKAKPLTAKDVKERKDLIHALLHGARRWAQLSTHLRQKGYKQGWMHDFIASGMIK